MRDAPAARAQPFSVHLHLPREVHSRCKRIKGHGKAFHPAVDGVVEDSGSWCDTCALKAVGCLQEKRGLYLNLRLFGKTPDA